MQKDEAGKELIKFDSATKTLDIAYEVVAKTTNGTGTTVNITDFFDTVNSSLPSAATYQQSTIKLIKVDADGNKTDVTTDYQDKLNVALSSNTMLCPNWKPVSNTFCSITPPFLFMMITPINPSIT